MAFNWIPESVYNWDGRNSTIILLHLGYLHRYPFLLHLFSHHSTGIMIKTGIILGEENNFPIWHKSAGLAKSLSIAWWLFEFTGWKQQGQNYPDMAYVVETIDWPEGDEYFPCDNRELFILENRLIMN
ncbi:hypothetical protein IC229_33180 [Spirosoma sp. BT702]|uniref:Uncharacterized protein n=1 Tax=Spirosoma profusum TaxID=2771354 RepID=A0A927AW51_9BACT|nr:hypothetical protein [Spirosoma profusum]MBD2705512.1 hypothetical protein [Spirosoma profusum]